MNDSRVFLRILNGFVYIFCRDDFGQTRVLLKCNAQMFGLWADRHVGIRQVAPYKSEKISRLNRSLPKLRCLWLRYDLQADAERERRLERNHIAFL
jgi:hypothetical protein